MKNQLLKRIFFFLSAVVLIVSCSKDDSADPVSIEGGQVFRYQAVTVTLADATLSEDEYPATFAGEQIVMKRTGANTLVFVVSPVAPIGKADLIISSLSNTKIHYDIKDTVLADTPDKVVEPFLNYLNSYKNGIDLNLKPEYATSVGIVNMFNSFYSTATAEQKEVIAKLYQSNKATFDLVLLNGVNSLSNTGKKFSSFSLETGLGVLVRAVGTIVGMLAVDALSTAFPPLAVAVNFVSVVVIGVALGAATVALVDFLHFQYKIIRVKIDSQYGENSKNIAIQYVSLQSDKSSLVPISFNARTIDASDATNKNKILAKFFSTYAGFSKAVKTINYLIDFVNDYSPLPDVSNVSIASIPSVGKESEGVLTEEVFNNFKFTISDPNLTLVSAVLQGNGQLNIKVKITGTPSSVPVESYLNYSYSDEYGSFSGKLPIKVNDGVASGWYVGTYVFGHHGSPGDVGYNSGGQFGETGKFYVFVGNPKKAKQIVVYIKSIIDGEPSIYTHGFYYASPNEDEAPSTFRVYCEEDLGPYQAYQLVRRFNLGTFYIDGAGITTAEFDHPMTYKTVPEQMGSEYATYAYNYDINNIHLEYKGTLPPADLTPLNVATIKSWVGMTKEDTFVQE